MANNAAVRIEHDSIGDLPVPVDAYFGVQTLRAVHNFPISGRGMPAIFIRSHALLKKCCAEVNMELGVLDKSIGESICKAAAEILEGKLADQFPVDVYQTGSGTSTNMNLNEVIASRANEMLGGRRGDKKPVHPNDHVNMGQSSNDTIPTSIHIACIFEIVRVLEPALHTLEASLAEKSRQLWDVIKTGRTHLQDATPIRLGQEFLGYRGQIERSSRRLAAALADLSELAIGGTAVGTGINAHPQFAAKVCERLSAALGYKVRETTNHFQAQSTLDGLVMTSGVLKTIAVSLTKIANDIRWMSCGPRAGLGEIEIPAVQPGSSIMPGKVNPVIAESLIMVCQRVIGNDATITAAGSSGNFELNVAMPVAAAATLESIALLGHGIKNFAQQCVDGIKATQRGPDLVTAGLMLATALAPVIGYEAAANIAKEAASNGKTILDVASQRTQLSPEELKKLLDPIKMVEPSDTIMPVSG